MLKVIKKDEKITVKNRFWEITHDAKKGGSITSLKLNFGSGKNLILSPLRCYVDDYDVINEDSPQIIIKNEGNDRAKVQVLGELKDSHKNKKGISYCQTFLYTNFFIKVEQKFIFHQPISANTVGACHLAIVPNLNEFAAGASPWTNLHPLYGEYFGPMEDQTWGKITFNNEPSFTEGYVPFDLSVFQMGVEGFQIKPNSEWFNWNEQIVPEKGKGRYAIIGQADPKFSHIILEPYANPIKAVTLKGEYKFTYYIGIPNISEKLKPRYMEVALKSTPWPSNEDIRDWAYLGVNVLRIHDEVDFKGGTTNYWHDGVYPPYDEEGMRELERVINTAHKYGIKIIPYFSMYECHPTSPAFRHVIEWKRTMKPNGHEQYTYIGLGNLFGVLLCPDSGWGRYFKNHVKLVLRKHHFDGVYFDWSTNIPCFNQNHMKGYHNGIDGIYYVIDAIRRAVGQKGIIFTHVQGQAMDTITINFSDQIVTLEEKQSKDVFGIEEMPSSIMFAKQSSVGIVPNILYPKKGDEDPRYRLKQGISRFILLGTFPYSYLFSEEKWDYKSFKEAREDPRGLYALFDDFKAIDFTEYYFKDCYHSPIKTTNDAVRGSVYWNKKHIVIVISNTGSEKIENVKWTIDLSTIGWKNHDLFSMIRSRGEDWKLIRGIQLEREGVEENLEEFGYKLYIVQRHTPNKTYVIHNTRCWKEKHSRGKLKITTSGSLGQKAELKFWVPTQPKMVTLDENTLQKDIDWSWDEATKLGNVKYKYGSNPHIIIIYTILDSIK